MAHKKAAGKVTQGTRSNPKYLGPKVSDGESVGVGAVLIRQRGTAVKNGDGVGHGRDHTLFALRSGIVKYGTRLGRKVLSVVSS
jgi:large subunit ribosomal protein L27